MRLQHHTNYLLCKPVCMPLFSVTRNKCNFYELDYRYERRVTTRKMYIRGSEIIGRMSILVANER